MDPQLAVAVAVAIFGVCFGAATGSFIGVVLYRVPRGEGLGGRSVCVCGRQLTWFENIPMLSWLALGGRARCCKAPIPAWFLATEVVTAAWCAAAGFLLGPAAVVGAAVVAVAVAAAFAFAHRRR